MASVDETNGNNNQLNAALISGLRDIDQGQQVPFKKYVRTILPLDGYVFWVRADLLSTAALYNASQFNFNPFNDTTTVISQAGEVLVNGYLHWSTDSLQEETESFERNMITFTAETDIDPFNEVGVNVMYIADYEGMRFAFSRRRGYNLQANLYHYQGESIYPTLQAQIVDDPATLDLTNVIVSNSLPFWLALNQYMPMYPSYLTESNILPPYAAVHIPPESTQAIQAAPYFDNNSNQWQLVSEKVIITAFGMRNFNILDFIQYVQNYALSPNSGFGISNMPVPRDEKRIQNEINAIAMKKSVMFEINYYQTRVRDVALKLITGAIPTIIPNPEV